MNMTYSIKWLVIFIILLTRFYLIKGVECEFCHKDFSSIGRHLWRCKAKLTSNNHPIVQNQPTNNVDGSLETPERSLANTYHVISSTNDLPDIRDNNSHSDNYTCYCGIKCKGLKVL